MRKRCVRMEVKMIRNNDNQNQPPCRCSFCGRTDKQVRRLIAGPTGVYICDECTELCEELLAEEYQQMYEEGEEIEEVEINLLKPKEIKEFLDEYVIGQEEAKRPFP